MAYKTLVRLDTGLHSKGDNLFLEQGEAKKLVQKGKEYKLLYFLRSAFFNTAYDFPVSGATEELLTRSYIKGPFDEKPEVKEAGERYRESIIEKIVLADSVPEKFQQIELLSYGIRSGEGPERYLNILGADPKKVKAVAESVLNRLEREVAPSQLECHDNTYQAFVDGCLAEFYHSDGFLFPRLHFLALGEQGKTSNLVDKFGLNHLISLFNGVTLFCFENCTQRGLAYNFSVQDTKSIRQAKEVENVIL